MALDEPNACATGSACEDENGWPCRECMAAEIEHLRDGLNLAEDTGSRLRTALEEAERGERNLGRFLVRAEILLREWLRGPIGDDAYEAGLGRRTRALLSESERGDHRRASRQGDTEARRPGHMEAIGRLADSLPADEESDRRVSEIIRRRERQLRGDTEGSGGGG